MSTDTDTPADGVATAEFFGERFIVADKVGMLPLMRFARISKGFTAGLTDGEAEMEALAAMLDLLEQCLHPAEFARFEVHANEHRADFEDFQEFVGQVMIVIANRPTGRSSDSPDGPRIIEPSSTDDSSSPDTAAAEVIDMFNQRGRGDLALLVRRRAESQTG